MNSRSTLPGTSGNGFVIDITGGGKGIRGDCEDYSADHVRVQHVEIAGQWDGDGRGNDGIYLYSGCRHWHLSHLYVHDVGRVHFLPHKTDDIVVESSFFARSESTPGEHSEPIAVQGGSNHVFRNNVFFQTGGTGCIVYKKNYAWQVSKKGRLSDAPSPG